MASLALLAAMWGSDYSVPWWAWSFAGLFAIFDVANSEIVWAFVRGLMGK